MGVRVTDGALGWKATIDDSEIDRVAARMESRIGSLSKRIKTEGEELDNWTKKLSVAAAGYFSIQAASDFVTSMVKVRGEFQQIEAAYRTMLGSKEKADKLMAESVKLAAITPFTLQDVASGSKQLLAYGFAAQDITKNLEMLGNIASGVGSQLSDVVYLYGTLKASGRVTQTDINQFAGRGIPIYQALADVMKINVEQVRDYVSAGKIGFPQVESAFNKLTGAGGQFYNLMQEQSKTLTGQLSNLEDAWSRMLNDLGQQNEGVFASAIGSAITLVDNYQEVLNILASLVVGYGAYRAALILSTVATTVATYATAGFTAAEILQFYWTKTLTAAQKLLNSTMLANPYVAVAAALAALSTYLILSSESAIKLKSASELTAEAVAKQGDAVSTTESKLRVYVQILKNTNISETERLNIYNKIKAIDPSIVKGIDAKADSYNKLKISVDAYIKSLRDKYAAEANESAIKASIENENKLKKDLENVGKETLKFSLARLADDKGLLDDENQKKSNEIKALILKQKIETNKLIGKSIQTGSKEQIDAAEKDLTILENDLKLYKKNSLEYLTQIQEIDDKRQEVLDLRRLKKQSENPNKPIKIKRTLKIIEEEIQNEKDDQKDSANDKEYLLHQQRIAALEKERLAITGLSIKAQKTAIDTDQEWADRKLELLEKVNDAFANAKTITLSQNEQEIESNKAKYRSLREEVVKYNEDAKKNKRPTLGSETFSMINNAEAKEEYEIKYKQQTAFLLAELDKQKSLYEAFEQYKLDFGEAKAKEKFQNDIDLNTTYQKIVEANLGKLLIKNPADMTKAEKDALEAVKIRNDEAIKADSDKNDALLKEFQDYAQKRQGIQEKYLTIAADFRRKGDTKSAQEAISRGGEEIKALDATQIKKMASYKQVFEFVGKRTKQQLLDAISIYQAELKAFKGSAEEKAKAQKELDELKKSLKTGSAKDLEDVVNQLSRVASEFASINDNIGSIAEVLLTAARSYVEIKKGIEDYKKAEDDDSTTGKITAGIGIAGAALGVVNSIVGYFKGLKAAKEAAFKAMNDYQAAAIKGELDYQALLRKREQDDIKRGKNSYRAIVDQLDLLKKQSPEIQKAYDRIFASLQGQSFVSGVGYQHGTWLRKAKTWDIMSSLGGSQFDDLEKLYTQGKLQDQAKADFESLKALREELRGAGIDVEELQGQLNEMLTGTTVGGLADSLTQLFENGKFAAADFGASFEEIMKKAITNSFKYKLLEDGLQPFYEEFSALFTNGTPDKAQIDALKAKYIALGQVFADKFKDLEAITGQSLTDSKGNSASPVTGSITAAGLTEDTANKSMGIWRGQYDLTKTLVKQSSDTYIALVMLGKSSSDLYNQSVANMVVLQQIEANTFRTANNTDNIGIKLDKIISNTSSGSSYQNLLNNGVKP